MINLSSPTPQESGAVLQFVDDQGPGLKSDASIATAASLADPSSTFDQDSPDGTSSTAQPAMFDGITPGFLKTARHPIVCVFHLVFKICALLTFIFGSFIFGGWNGDYVFTFVTTTVFLSVDFWTVKNVTGRVLVGMRWWNSIKEDGSSDWIFESSTDERYINTTDKTVFWTTLYLWTLTWIIFLILYIIRLQIDWVLLVAVGLTLSMSNLVGYWKCSKDAKRRMKEWASTQAMRSILGRFGA